MEKSQVYVSFEENVFMHLGDVSNLVFDDLMDVIITTEKLGGFEAPRRPLSSSEEQKEHDGALKERSHGW